jgi:hypothetical protein
MKSDPSASKTATIAMSESSVGSSSEVNSPVSFAITKKIGEKNKRTRWQQQPSTKPSKYNKRSKSSGERRHRRLSGKQSKNLIISRRVEPNQSSHRARLSYTDRCKTQYFLKWQNYLTTLCTFCRSQTSSSSTTWVYARLQVPEHRLGGYSLIRLQRIHNFWCSMLVFTPFAQCFVTLCGTFMHFPELTY